MKLKIFKKKFFIVFVLIFVIFCIAIMALKDYVDDDIDEIETKFPLEDYLFQDSKQKEIDRLKQQQESDNKDYAKIQEELQALQNQLDSQSSQVESQQTRIMLSDIRNKDGKLIELDEQGRPILYTKDGKRVYLDENGMPYILDENGNKVFLNPDEPIFDSNGVPLERDRHNRVVFYDSDNNKVTLEDGKKITTKQDGSKIIEDNKGNYKVFDKNGNLIAKGNKNEGNPDYNPFASDTQYAKNANTANTLKESPTNSQNPDLYYDEDGNLIGDSVAKENQKFIYEKADDKQRIINDVLASRFDTPQKEKKKYEKEYGVDSFSNFEDKDEGSNEHKLLRTITADRMIPAFLIRPISSQIAGNVVAQVESNIYGAMGRAVLIPKGSKVIGFYQSNNKIGEYRLSVIWTRIITPHGINILLTDARGADVKGYNGLVGEVHSRNFERYGIPLSLSTLSNGLLLAVNSMSQKSQTQQSETSSLASAYMQSQILSGMRQDVSSIIQKIIQEQIKIQPIITIREGSRIFIAPTQDIFIPIPKNGEALARFFNEVKEVPNKTLSNTNYQDTQNINESQQNAESNEDSNQS